MDLKSVPEVSLPEVSTKLNSFTHIPIWKERTLDTGFQSLMPKKI